MSDLESLFEGFVENKEELVEEPKKKAKSRLFDILNSINFQKDPDLLKDEEIQKQFNSWMILRWLSMDENKCDLINMVNEYQSILSKEQFYMLLCELVPKNKAFVKYIKSESLQKDFQTQLISEWFECSFREAREYIETMPEGWSESIQDKLGGIRK